MHRGLCSANRTPAPAGAHLVRDPVPVLRAPRHGGDRHVRHEADGAQRLAPEAQRADGLQVLEGGQLAGGVAVAQDG